MVPSFKDESREPLQMKSGSRFNTVELDYKIQQIVGKSMVDPFRSEYLKNHSSIVDSSGKLLGFLQSGTNANDGQRSIDLIDISSMTILPRYFEFATRCLPEIHFRCLFLALNVVYDFCNVLSVKWQGGVAYRIGFGRILKATCESSNYKQVELILG
jgi:hypothetical protein